MDKIKYSLFDLFAYLTPGFVLLNALFYASSGQSTFSRQEMLAYAGQFNPYSFIFVVLLSYCAGFMLQPIGEIGLLLLQKFKPFASPRPHHHTVGHSVKHTVIREKSPENYRYVELWYVIRGFSASMAIVFLFLALYLLCTQKDFTWKSAALGVAFSAVLFGQAIKFNTWAIIDLDNAYTAVLSSPDTSLQPRTEGETITVLPEKNKSNDHVSKH